MDISMEEFVKIADDTFEKYEKGLEIIYEKIHMEMLMSMRNKNVSINATSGDKEVEFLPSWETILLEQRLSDKIKSMFDTTILFTDNYFKINKEARENDGKYINIIQVFKTRYKR